MLQIVSDEDEVMIVTNEGKMIRIAMENVRVMSRNTQGVTLVRMDQESGGARRLRGAGRREGHGRRGRVDAGR